MYRLNSRNGSNRKQMVCKRMELNNSNQYFGKYSRRKEFPATIAAVYNSLRKRQPLLISQMEDMTSNLAMVSARRSNEFIRNYRIGTLKVYSDHGGVSYVVSRSTFSANARTRNVPSATHRHTVSTTILVGGQELEDDGEGRGPHLYLSAENFWR